MKINVRMFREKDFEEVAKLIARLKSLNEELNPHFKAVSNVREIALKYVEETSKSENAFILVAENWETGEIIGVIRIELVDRIFYEPRIKAVITDIYVKPKYRRKRVGVLLLEKAIAEAKRRGAGILSAIYPYGNVLAAEFYKKQGFSELQREVYKPL